MEISQGEIQVRELRTPLPPAPPILLPVGGLKGERTKTVSSAARIVVRLHRDALKELEKY